MSVFSEIMDIVKMVGGEEAIRTRLDTKQYSSISKRASEGTLQFPVLVTRSLDIETMQIITKALERNYATFVQTVLSMSAVMDIDENRDISDYLKKFHQNTGMKFDRFDAMNTLDSSIMDSYNVFENENFILFGAVYEGATNRIVASNKEQLINLMEDLRADILNRKYTPKVEAIYNFTDTELSKKYNARFNKAFEASDENEREKLDYQRQRDAERDNFDRAKFDHQVNQDTIRNTTDATKFRHQRNIDARRLQNDNIKQGIDRERLNHQRRMDMINASRDSMPTNILKDNDVKKANELIATTLHIRLKLINKDNIDSGYLDFILGVKCTMHPIKSEEMINNMVSACKNNNKAFNFLRWTTGEISFFKDFLFNIKEVKEDVVNRSKGASPWWITLKRRKALAKLKDSMFTKNRLLPNATIVLSLEEVEMIKNEYGYDIFNPLFTNKIMETFYLLGLVIVDTSSQMAHFLFDGHTDFQTVSFSGLEKENTNTERKFKEMLKVINRN